MSGPLTGLRIIEIGGIGATPFAGMLLADLGAEVIQVSRISSARAQDDVLTRGRKSIMLDLKRAEGVAVLTNLVAEADAVIEGFRPGVAERLGFGPRVLMETNPALVYGRMTGWGQEGPLSQLAGHDVNYISLSGALDSIGVAGGPPVIPLNLIGDYAGGGLLLAFGVVSALLEAKTSGRGQVIDAAMVDGAALLMTVFYSFRASGFWKDRGENILDSGAPFYGVYETSDGKFVSIGSLEPDFYLTLLGLLEIDPASLPPRLDRDSWPATKVRFAEVFSSRPRDEWCEIFEGTDACFAPVLSVAEAPLHPHNVARESFVDIGGITQPAPGPRFSRTPSSIPLPPPRPGEHTSSLLEQIGYSAIEIDDLRKSKVIE